MKYRIIHKTVYRYSEPASLSQNELILSPRTTDTQRVTRHHLAISPEPQYENCRTDFFGNTVQMFMIQHPHDELTMIAESHVETPGEGQVDVLSSPSWEEVAEQLATHSRPADLDAYQFVFESPMIDLDGTVNDYTRPSFPPGRSIMEGALDLMGRIFSEFTYDKNATTIDTRIAQVLESRKGVCQDFAHLAIGCLRSIGLAARYVSGYLETLPPQGKPKLVGADASHAWLSLYVPDQGWVDLDPTNNLIPGNRHITLAWGRDYGDVTPVKGVVMGGGMHTLSVMVDVSPQS